MSKYLKSDEIIDLELFINEDKGESEDYKNNRDFEFYSQASDFNKSDDIKLLAFWIEKMRCLSNKLSIGKFTQMLFAFFAIVLIALGAAGGCAIFSLSKIEGSDSFFSINALFWVFCVVFILIFTWVFYGILASVVNFILKFIIKLIFGARGNLGLVEKKNKNYFRARAKFLCQFLGLGLVLSIFFNAYFAFDKKDINFEYKSDEFINVESFRILTKCIAFPWSFTFGEGVLYPSFADVEYAELAFSPEMEILCEKPYMEQDIWKNFFLLSIFVYGILARILIFFIHLFKGRNNFGKYKMLNDRDISILLNRIKLSSSNKKNWQNLKNDKDCKNLLILRSDLIAYSDIITQKAAKQSSFDKFNIFKYEFLSEFFTEDFSDMQSPYKNFTIAFLSDDYNDEVFENMQNLINTYPEKTLNILLLGRYDKSLKSFDELVSVEKSWWQRKLNAISTENINIY